MQTKTEKSIETLQVQQTTFCCIPDTELESALSLLIILDSKDYNQNCRWFYKDDFDIPLCWGGLDPNEGILYPDCQNCKRYEPL